MPSRARTRAASLLGALALATAAALAGAQAASADTEPSFFAGFNGDITIGVDPSPGKAVPLYGQMIGVQNPSIAIDTSGLAGVATVDTPDGCTASGTTVTC